MRDSALPPDLAYHGGNLAGARRLFPDAPTPWLDLSTGINPLSYPVGEILTARWTRLPEPDEVTALETIAAARYGARSGSHVIAAPGTQSLIQILPRVMPRARIGILGFTYAEYERVWRDLGADITLVDDVAALARFDVAVVVNPNNPDGRLVPVDRLRDVAERLAARDGLLVVDEAFVDLLGPEASLIPQLPGDGALVLRSFGKSYGLAGVRLGFAVTGPRLAGGIRRMLGPWAVSGPAIEIGRNALSDSAWIEQAARVMGEAAAALAATLSAYDFRIIGGTPLFTLAENRDAARWFNHLGRHGILVRPFPAQPTWLRFGTPHGIADGARLRDALGKFAL